MATFGEAVGAGVRAGFCSIIEEDSAALALLGRLNLSDNPLRNAVRGFRSLYCGNNTSPGAEANFTGGQCVVDYNVTVKVDRFFQGSQIATGDVFSPGQSIRGPISSITLGPQSDKATITHNNGVVTTFPSGTSNPQISWQNLRDITIDRVDGLPDNCGNASGPLPEPTTGPLVGPISVTYNNNNGDEVTNEGNLRIYAPIFRPTFSPRIPVRFDVGGIDFNGTLNADGTLDIDLGLGTGPGADNPNPQPPEGEPPEEGEVIIGARVTVVSDTGSTTTRIPNGDRPDLFIPRAGTIQFLQPAGDESAWSADIPIKTSPQWIPCGEPGYATKIAYTPTLGVTLSVIAVRGRPPNA